MKYTNIPQNLLLPSIMSLGVAGRLISFSMDAFVAAVFKTQKYLILLHV